MTQPTIPSRVPAGATPEGDGIVVGAGLVDPRRGGRGGPLGSWAGRRRAASARHKAQ